MDMNKVPHWHYNTEQLASIKSYETMNNVEWLGYQGKPDNLVFINKHNTMIFVQSSELEINQPIYPKYITRIRIYKNES
jgi:hypothetical protein